MLLYQKSMKNKDVISLLISYMRNITE